LVLRCPSCTEVVLRFAARRGRLLDLRGAQLLVIPVADDGSGTTNATKTSAQ
jgi:hypothetical protein